jgi:hypothetical protein
MGCGVLRSGVIVARALRRIDYLRGKRPTTVDGDRPRR